MLRYRSAVGYALLAVAGQIRKRNRYSRMSAILKRLIDNRAKYYTLHGKKFPDDAEFWRIIAFGNNNSVVGDPFAERSRRLRFTRYTPHILKFGFYKQL